MALGKKIAIIGAGNMGEALISGMLAAKAAAPDNIHATDILPQRLDHLKARYQVRVGVSAMALGGNVSRGDERLAWAVLESVGQVVLVDERLMDAVTGLSGSGPAYIFLIIEALADGGVKMGLPREAALALATQTVLGSARMVLETGEHPGRLKDKVASPGGT